jgi:transposase
MQAVLMWIAQKTKNVSSVARRLGTSPRFVKRWVSRYCNSKLLVDLPRPGRPRTLTAKVKAAIRATATSEPFLNSTSIARRFNNALGASVSSSRVRAYLRSIGARVAPMASDLHLTPADQEKRVQFCKDNYRTAWRGVLITDSTMIYSKPSYRNKAARRHGWKLRGRKPVVPSNTAPVFKAHVYAGVSFYGKTPLVFVTGTHGVKSKYINPRTAKPFDGVCALEYQDVVRDVLVPEAAKIFSTRKRWANKWTFQQDNAKPHKTVGSMELLRQSCPKFMENWPPHSPDLSWIEKIWAVLKKRVAGREPFTSFEAFKQAITEEWDAISLSTLQNNCDAVAARLVKSVELDGACTS